MQDRTAGDKPNLADDQVAWRWLRFAACTSSDMVSTVGARAMTTPWMPIPNDSAMEHLSSGS